MKSDTPPAVQLDYQSARQLYMFLFSQGNALRPELLGVFEKLQSYMFRHHSIQELEQLTAAVAPNKNYV